MKVRMQSLDGRATIEFEAPGVKELFQRMGKVSEIINVEACGCCNSKRTVQSFRQVKGYDYYSFQCLDCQAQLNFGQYKDGRGLFLKRSDEEGRPLGKNGWHHYHKQQQAPAPGGSPPDQAAHGDSYEGDAPPSGDDW